MYEAYLECSEGWRGLRTKSLPWGRYGYFLELRIIKKLQKTPIDLYRELLLTFELWDVRSLRWIIEDSQGQLMDK